MKNKLILAAICAAVVTVGCSTNKQQVVESVSGDGVQANATIPVTSSSSIGLKLFVGRVNTTTAVNPTATNQLYAASVGVVVGGAGKQGVGGSVTTNANGSITDGSRDGSAIILGNTTGNVNQTNGISASGQH